MRIPGFCTIMSTIIRFGLYISSENNLSAADRRSSEDLPSAVHTTVCRSPSDYPETGLVFSYLEAHREESDPPVFPEAVRQAVSHNRDYMSWDRDFCAETGFRPAEVLWIT